VAFRSNSPMSVTLPPFRGVTRRILLTALGTFFALLVISLISRGTGELLENYFSFSPLLAYKLLWQLVTYPFIASSILGLLFAALSVWFFGAVLEDELGSRWMAEFFFVTTIGGALLAGVLALTVLRRVPGLEPEYDIASGLWPFSLALLLAYARLHADQQLNFNFILHVKAKYLAAIYLLVYLAIALSAHERFDAMLVLTNALCGWAFLVLAPRRGVGFAVHEQVYGIKNAWVRARRRRAARKFSVYMQKQGREVNFDASGRYVDPDAPRDPREPKGPRDPDDRSWMN
jgi:membrane associated rhomboid family serine protease